MAQIVLCGRCRYTAQSLQINQDSTAPTASHPIAVAPGGVTTTDTMQPVTVLENQKSDVTTTFTGSVTVEKNDPKASTFSSPAFIKAMTTEYTMTLKKTLCRPIQVAYGNWATTDAVGANLMSNYVPEILLALPIISRKLDGFQGIRGSITLRLQATANPFQQGLLKLQFYPMYDQDATASYRMLAQESWSFLPGVELNLAKETACELRIPFTLPVSFCDLMIASASLRPQMGAIFIKVYSPLKVGPGTSTVGWNLYAHWNEDDLELLNPTPNIYQSGKTKHLMKASTLPADKEKKSTSISESLAVGAELAEIATAVPVLADIAGPTEWAMRLASRVASVFGFSRPPIDEKPRIVTQNMFPYNSLTEGPDVSMPLSQTVQPCLKQEPSLGGKKEDEMTIDYFVTKFGFQQTVNIDGTLLIGQNLFTINLTPAAYTVAEQAYPKPFQMLGKLFRFWRGNIRVRVKFIKTKMHTARMMFAFFPGIYVAQTLALSEYVHREVVDISSVEELVFELPFTSQYPYLFTTSTQNQGSYGTFQCFLVNPLQAPSSVANNIDMIIETAMGEGAEFFCPSAGLDLLPQIPASSVLEPKTEKKAFDALGINQGQSGPSGGGLVRVSTLSDAQITGHQSETAQLCVGEKLLSLRQIIKIPTQLAVSLISVGLTTSASGTFSSPVFYQPFSLGATNPSGTNSVRTRDMLGLLAPYFRFSRGGMRVRGTFGLGAMSTFSTEQNHCICANADSATNIAMAGVDIAGPTLPWGGETTSSAEKIWKYLIPPWQTVPMVDHHYVLASTIADTSLIGRQSCVYLRGFNYPGSTSIIIQMARQPADDYELISFIGPPRFTSATA